MRRTSHKCTSTVEGLYVEVRHTVYSPYMEHASNASKCWSTSTILVQIVPKQYRKDFEDLISSPRKWLAV